MIPGIKPAIAEKKLWDFLIAAKPFMSANDRDGVGYAAQSNRGLWGERWLDPADAWSYRQVWTADDEKLKAMYGQALDAEPRFSKFGVADPSTTFAVLYHTRMATCEKNLTNVHPFVRGNTALIHNGVISNHATLIKLNTTCDSEVILNEYVQQDVTDKPEAIKEVTAALRGYYACGVLTTGADGVQYMDIFRNPTAHLWALYVDELETVVFCTNPGIVQDTCRKLGWKYGVAFRFKDELMIRLNARTGELVSTSKFLSASEYSARSYNNYDSYYRREDLSNGDSRDYPSMGKRDEKKSLSNDSMVQTISTQLKNSTLSGNKGSEAGSCEVINDPFGVEGEGYRKNA